MEILTVLNPAWQLPHFLMDKREIMSNVTGVRGVITDVMYLVHINYSKYGGSSGKSNIIARCKLEDSICNTEILITCGASGVS